MAHIGTLNERTLHRELKELVSESGDEFEVDLDGYVIDIVRGDQLIEIQTGSLGALGKKLDSLLESREITVVVPVAVRAWYHKPDGSVRKAPVKRTVYDLFGELVSVPTLIDHPNFSIEVVLIEEDTRRVHDPQLRRRRGGYRTVDRSIRSVVERRRLTSADDLMDLVPADLPDVFTTKDLAEGAEISRRLAQQMAYCFRALGVFIAEDRTKAGVKYRLATQV